MADHGQTPVMSGPRLARPADQILHPWAWWAWAICLAVAANLTTNPLFLLLLAFALVVVILLRRSDAPWARSISAYFILAAFVIGMRLFFRILVGGAFGETVLFTLPEFQLPDWAQGISLGGPVTAEGLLYTVYDSLRLVVMLLAIAAANALANPRRALRSVPAALHDISVAVVVALSVAPQLVESLFRIRKARRLRGGKAKGLDAIKAYLVPIVADAIDRSLALAASMEARGFGRTRTTSRRRLWTNVLMLVSGMVSVFGGFLVLNAPNEPPIASIACLAAGAAGVIVGLRISGDKVGVTRYRPDPWGAQEWVVVGSGLAVFGTVLALSNAPLWEFLGVPFDPDVLNPPTWPLAWPTLPLPLLLAALAALVPLLVTRSPIQPRTRDDGGIAAGPDQGDGAAGPVPTATTDHLAAGSAVPTERVGQ